MPAQILLDVARVHEELQQLEGDALAGGLRPDQDRPIADFKPGGLDLSDVAQLQHVHAWTPLEAIWGEMLPVGIEPTHSVPETDALSTELRERVCDTR